MASTDFEIQLAKSAYDPDETGVVMPRLVQATTDEFGDATVNLWPSDQLYHVTVVDPVSEAAIYYKFYVPVMEEGQSVRLQDIVVDAPMSTTPYDEAALLVIQDTKALVLNYKNQAAASAAASAATATAAANAAAAVSVGEHIADYAALRLYDGPAKNLYVTGYLVTAAPAGNAGWFTMDDVDVTTPDNGGTVIVGVGGKRWKRRYDGAVNILWFIPPQEHAAIVGRNSTYDCHDAIIAAIESVYTGQNYYWSGPEVYFPPGRYRVLSTINIKRQVKLRGTTGAVASNDGGSELSFPMGVGGIITNSFNTDGLGGITGSGSYPDPTFSSAGSVIEGFRLIADVRTDITIPGINYFPNGHKVLVDAGVSAASNPEAHGIRMRGMCLIRNCFLYGFEGDGIHIVASAVAPATDPALGNDNLFRLEGIAVQRCAKNGVFVDLADVNAGSGYNINVVQNSAWGIFDSSFLGNTWVACHANTNFAGDYKTDNVNASSLFLNCYSENGAGPSSFSTGTLVIGGALAGGIDFTAGVRYIGAGGATAGVRIAPSAEIGYLSLGIQGTSSTADTPRSTGFTLRYQDTTATTGSTSYWSLNREVGRLVWQKANVGAALSYYDAGCTVANGYARNFADAPMTNVGQIGLGTHFFGGKTEMKYRGLSTVAPTVGEYLRGDIIWSSIPAAAGKMGWVCTTGGTAGSTAVFKQFGAVDA